MNSLGRKIKFKRKSSKLTQEDLTCDILNRSSLSKIENDLLIPSLLQLKHISRKLDVSLDYLLDDDILVPFSSLANKEKMLIEKLYINGNFLDIIEGFSPKDFSSTYYIGMSYYNLELKLDAELLLAKCESLFSSLLETDRIHYVTNLCIAINSLRKMRVKSLSDSSNLKYLKKAISLLDQYCQNKSEIYFSINNNLGVYYLLNSEHELAVCHFTNFISNNLDLVAPRTMPYIYLNLSLAYFSLKNYDASITFLNKAIFCFNLIDDKIQAGECYLNLFNCYLYKNDISKCKTVFQSLSEYYLYPELYSRLKVLELTLLYNQNDIDTILKEKKTINYSILKTSTKADYNFLMARMNFIIKNYNNSYKFYCKCIKYLIQKNKLLDLTIAYSDLFTITKEEKYKKLHMKYKALYLTSKYNSLFCDITSPYYPYISQYIF